MKRQLRLNPTESHLIYQLDENTRVTPFTIQQILDRTNKSDYQLGLKKAFDLLHNLRILKNQPDDTTLKQAIIQNLETVKSPEFQITQSINKLQGYRLDINKSYLMNKSGGIGMLQRRCKFTQKGVLQMEQGKKQPKLKQIQGFNNMIEKFKDKLNISKLQWVKQSGKYPFRIVLIDKNKADKGVYFQSLAQASAVQVYLIQKYNSRQASTQVKALLDRLAGDREVKGVQNLGCKMKVYALEAKNMRKSYQKNRQKTNINQVQPNSSKHHQDTKSGLNYDKQSVFLNNNFKNNKTNTHNINNNINTQRQSNTKSQQFRKQQRQSSQVQIQDTRTQLNFKKTKNSTNKQYESSGTNNQNNNYNKTVGLFPRVNMRKVQQRLGNYNYLCLRDLLDSWKQKAVNLDQINKSTDRLRQSHFSRSVLNGMTDHQLLLNSLSQSGQKQQEQLSNTLRFTQFELQINPSIPFKPYVTIQLIHKHQQNNRTPHQKINRNPQHNKQLKFNTFQGINQTPGNNLNSIRYELIQQDNGDNQNQKQGNSNEVHISSNYSNYIIRFTLINILTEDIVIQKQTTLDSMKVKSQKFTISINEDSSTEPNTQIPSEPPIVKLIGTIDSLNPKTNPNHLFDYLFFNIQSLTSNSSHDQQAPTNDNELTPHISKEHQRAEINQAMITLIPQLQPQLKQQLHQIMQRKTYHINDQCSYLPVQYLKQLSPSQQQLTILSVTAQFLRNKHIAPIQQRYLFILRTLTQTNIFPSQQQLTQGFVSILMKWSGEFLNCSNDQLSLAKVIGFEDDQIDKISQKISLSLHVIQFLLLEQCPVLVHKMNRRNIPLPYLCVDYCHHLVTKNFQPQTVLSILTHIFNSYDQSHQTSLILTVIYLCKHLQQELVNCYKLEEVQFVLENSMKYITNAPKFITGQSSIHQDVEKFITQKWLQYFSNQHKHNYAQHYQQIRSQFYQAQGQQLKSKKQNRHAQKSTLTSKFSSIPSNPSIKPPSYKPKSHCLHIFFVSLPQISGSLYLKTSLTQFECVDYQKNPYFVISNLDSKVQLEFIDSKSNHYTFDLIFDAGFGFFKHQINDTNNSTVLKFQYWSGLFDESSIDYQYKNTKDIESSLSSDLTLRDLKYKLNKQFSDSKLMRAVEKVCYNNGKSDLSLQELSRKIKTAFSQFQNKVNEYDLFLYLLAQRKVSFEQKLHTLFEFAKTIEQELFLSQNSCLHRIVLYDFLKLMDIPIKFRSFQALYQNISSKTTQTCVPKVFKARFYFMYQEKRQIKLENELYCYIEQRAQKYVYTDIDVKELLIYLKPKILTEIEQIERKIGRKIKLDEGQLKLVISSQGQVEHYLFKVSVKNNNREFTVQDQSLPQISYLQKLQKAVPKVLYHHTAPQIANENQQNIQSDLKLVSRFKSTNMKSSNLVQSRINQLISQKSINPQSSDISEFERTNLCKFIMAKSKAIIRFRYKVYPREVAFKNFNLFADLNVMLFGAIENKELSSMKSIFLNNREVKTLEFLNDFERKYKFGTSQNSQLYDYLPQIGLSNNLQLLKQKNSSIPRVYFYTSPEKIPRKLTGKVMINHGFGVIRWENAIIKGYFRLTNDLKKKKSKEIYLISVNNQDKLAQQKLLKSYPTQVPFLAQITPKALSKMPYPKI